MRSLDTRTHNNDASLAFSLHISHPARFLLTSVLSFPPYIAGLGFEAARQLALVDTTQKVILGCRNPTKAQTAQAELEELTGVKKFDFLEIDVSDLESCKKAAELLNEPVDGIICVC